MTTDMHTRVLERTHAHDQYIGVCDKMTLGSVVDLPATI